jgi:hypothetical protein
MAEKNVSYVVTSQQPRMYSFCTNSVIIGKGENLLPAETYEQLCKDNNFLVYVQQGKDSNGRNGFVVREVTLKTAIKPSGNLYKDQANIITNISDNKEAEKIVQPEDLKSGILNYKTLEEAAKSENVTSLGKDLAKRKLEKMKQQAE